MREINSAELKQIQLDMLLDFAMFCDKNNLTYYLGGGTLLGAVRHKGFIPWDDDIDIMMPREDFEKAVKLYWHEYYRFNYITNNNEWTEQIGKVCDIRTYLNNDSLKNTDVNDINSIGIDVCPIDYLPNGDVKQKILFWMAELIKAIHSASVLTIKPTKRFNDRNAGILCWKKWLRTGVKYIFIGLFGNTNPRFWVDLLNRLVIRKNLTTYKYMAGIVSVIHGSKEKMPIEIYEPKILLDFEGYKFWSPHNYDYYLKRLYGNYMELPPVEKRQSHHNFKAYWK